MNSTHKLLTPLILQQNINSDQKNTTYKLPASSVTLMRCSAGTGMDTISSNAAGLQKYPSCKQKEIQ